jgi:hypothetical protein
MKRQLLACSLMFIFCHHLIGQKIPSLPAWKDSLGNVQLADWLLHPSNIKPAVYYDEKKKNLVFYNGFIKRSFRISPNLACVDFTNLANQQQLIRAVSPEAKLIIDGREYHIGGLSGQKEKAYLTESVIGTLRKGKNDFIFDSVTVSGLQPFLNWKPILNNTISKQAEGLSVSFQFHSPLPDLRGILVSVHYELYEGMPLMVKWLSIENAGSRNIFIGRVVNEILSMPEEESAVVGTPAQMKTQQGIYVETNYAFNNAMRYSISDQTTHWKIDSSYTSQVNYNFETPCVLEIFPDFAPGIVLEPGQAFRSIRSYELLMDSYDHERRGLAVRKMYRKIAPWTSQNPIFMHLVSKNDEEVKVAIEQCSETGYEAIILSFGSHLNMEDSSANNIKRWKELAAYAHDKGIKIGGYSLFSSRKISDTDDVVSPVTGKTGNAFFGNAPCFGSHWGLSYRDKIKYFFENTGFDIWENDGPYPGDRCASKTHPGHTGLDDSQWKQIEIQKELYRWLNERGVYINAPDWYFLDGTHKIALGYREVNFSLPRDQQKILNRQNIFDGTWEKTPSMGWGFVPLTRYQGGGPEAILEPLSDHLEDYMQLMMQYYGAGIQACYRGPRLYDTDQTKEAVVRVIQWYNKYRDILNADIIHLRRADGRDWDGFMHADPSLPKKGFIMLFNPTPQKITRIINLPLYYTGLTKEATITAENGVKRKYQLQRDYCIRFSFTLDAGKYGWYVIE